MPTLRTTRNLLTAVVALCLTPLARAATPDCDASATPLNCKLQGVLSFLYGAAGVLGLILLAIILIAVRIYRRNKNDRDLLP